MSSSKYLKNSLGFDLMYRSNLKNPLALPSVKKSSFLAADISSLPKTLFYANVIKVLSSSTNPKISVASTSVNEFSIRKGDPVGCCLVLSKGQTSDFVSSCSLAFSSMAPPSFLSANLNQAVLSFSFRNLQHFLPFTHYEASLSGAPRLSTKLSFSIYFSGPLRLGSICLFSTYFPYFGFKKKINNFRTILREIEQAG